MNVSLIDTLRVIANLMSDDAGNSEYDRACVEIALDLLPFDGEDDTRLGVDALLRKLR